MLLHKCIVVHEVINPVRRKKVLQFKPPNPGSVSYLDIKIVIHFVVVVHNLDSERL
jgi:hypothetical protein